MADYKLVDVEKLEAGLTATANAIREKTGSTEEIVWDNENGMAEAVKQMAGGSGEEIVAYPWEVSHENGTDMFGEYTVARDVNSSSAKTGNVVRAHVKFIKPNDDESNCSIPLDQGRTGFISYDLTLLPEDYFLRFKTIAEPDDSGKTVARLSLGTVVRIVFPEKCAVFGSTVGNAPAYTYLPKKIPFDGRYNYTVNGKKETVFLSMTAAWVSSGNAIYEKNVVKCPKDAEIPYYLNKFTYITAEDMVGIFENMIDRSGETTTATITLGTDNLAKLTDEQKQIAIDKGWSLA